MIEWLRRKFEKALGDLLLMSEGKDPDKCKGPPPACPYVYCHSNGICRVPGESQLEWKSKRCADPWKHHGMCRCLQDGDKPPSDERR